MTQKSCHRKIVSLSRPLFCFLATALLHVLAVVADNKTPVAVQPAALSGLADSVLSVLLSPEACGSSERARIIVGDFPCNNAGNEGFSTVSRVLEDEFAAAITRRKDLELITRQKLGALMEEKKLGDLDFLDPRTSPTKISLKAAEILVRGHYIYSYPIIIVKAEAIKLHGGTVIGSLTVRPSIGLFPDVDVLPRDPPSALAEKALPQKTNETKTNRESVEDICRKLPNREIPVSLWTVKGRTHFQEGERIAFAIRAAKDCYIAVFCHQIDGGTVLLFPNRHNGDTRVHQGQVTNIPGAGREDFFIEIAPPFGGDIVQVIASNKESALARLVAAAQPIAGSPYATLSRSLLARRMQVAGACDNDAPPQNGATASGPTLYGELHILINTYPK